MPAKPDSQPPRAEARPVTRTIGGITYEDPYAWLEDDTPDTLAWQTAQNDAALAHVGEWPGFETVRASVAGHLAEAFLVAPLRAGDRWFQLHLDGPSPRLTVGPTAAAAGERVLVDVAELGDDRGPASLDWFYPSPDGGLVAYGVSFGGDEQSVLHVIEVDSGRTLEDRIPFCSGSTVAWLPDSSGFYYNGGLAPSFDDVEKRLFLHRLGDRERSAPEPIVVREPDCVLPQLSPDGRYLVAVTSEMDSRADLIRELPDGEWRPFLEGMSGYGYGFFDGEDYVCVSTYRAPRGRLVRIPVATAREVETWVELVPESPDVVLKTVECAGEHAVLTRFRDAYAEISVLDLDGNHVVDVELPGRGAVLPAGFFGSYQAAAPAAGGNVNAAPGEFTFVFSTLTRSAALYRYDIEARRLEELRPPAFVLDDELVVEELETTAPDGAAVRYKLVRRRDADPGKPLPTVIHGYGGWNVSFVPGYPGQFMPILDAGGAFVLAHLRGGGEFGTDFWADGRLERKQHTLDDLYAIAGALVREGRTTIDRLGLMGLSNGGLGTGVALTQRPELFGAVVSMVPLYDMLYFDRDPYTATCVYEYGDPHDPEAARWLHAYSPTHNVRPAHYPATLIVCGLNDMRCWPWHARKLAAALQPANEGGKPVLLRAAEDGGHASVMLVPDLVAEWVSFLMRELRIDPVPRR